MLVASLLVTADNIRCKDDSSSSKKRVIENISHLLAANTEAISADTIFQGLLDRERLGSTGLGKGVAIPHARMPGIMHTVAAMITLETPVDYDAPDGKPVDIIFGLLVPENGDESHLQNLSRLVTLFRDENVCKSIRETTDAEVLFDLLLAIDDD
jgi:PTS system nitrogen regulatory IIA component